MGSKSRRSQLKIKSRPNILRVIESSTLDMVKLFVHYGADLNVKDTRGRSALNYALNNFTDHTIFEYILDHQKIDVNQKDRCGCHLLHHAVIAGNSRACFTLLQRGARFWSKNRNLETPFLLAMQTSDDHQAMADNFQFGREIFGPYIQRAEDVVNVFIRQLAVYMHLKRKINESDVLEMTKEEQDYLDECSEELNLLKTYKVYRSVTLYDAFTASESSYDNYYRNPEFLGNFKRLPMSDKFPNYSELLKCKFDQQVQRQDWIKRVSPFLAECFGLNDASHIVIREIVRYLGNNEVKRIAEQL